jgi:hypothetical protein
MRRNLKHENCTQYCLSLKNSVIVTFYVLYNQDTLCCEIAFKVFILCYNHTSLYGSLFLYMYNVYSL